MQTVLFDLAVVVSGVVPHERMQVLSGDFLHDPLPPADLYLLKLILHDWPDATALNILSAIRHAAPDGGKLLVIEPLLTEGSAFHASHIMNISMLALVGGRERTPGELGRMFEDTGFRLTRVVRTTSPVAQIVEAEAV